MHKLKTAGLKLNADKFFFQGTQLKCLGHVLIKDSLSVDSDTVSAIPGYKKQLERFLGMITCRS